MGKGVHLVCKILLGHSSKALHNANSQPRQVSCLRVFQVGLGKSVSSARCLQELLKEQRALQPWTRCVDLFFTSGLCGEHRHFVVDSDCVLSRNQMHGT